MKIENIQINDLEAIVKLHKQNLSSPSSKIGEAYLEKLYRLLLLRPDLNSGLLLREKKDIVGVITATKDLYEMNKSFNKVLSPSVIFLLLKAIILRKVTVKELWDRVRFEQLLMKKNIRPYPVILTLFVNKNYQGSGFGKKIVNEMLQILKKKGIKKVYVDTLSTNKKALGFYLALGFKQKETIADSFVLEKVLR